MQDEALRFESICKEIEHAISNIKELGFDTSIYEETLKTIKREVSINVREKVVKNFAEASYTALYSKGITSLNKLKNEIEKYDTYVRIYNSCAYIGEILSDEEINDEKILEIVSKMISNLITLKSSSIMDYVSEERIILKVYEVTYNLIKLEIIRTGESQLYCYIKERDSNNGYLNSLIKNDIDRIKSNKKLKNKLYEIKQNGIYSNLIDIELIKLILASDKNNNMEKSITNRLVSLVSEIEENDKNIVHAFGDISKLDEQYNWKKRNLDKDKKELKKRGISFGLVLALVLTGGVAIEKLLKKLFTIGYYEKCTEIYSSISDSVTSNEDNVYFYDREGAKEKISIVVYDKYNGEKERNYLEYDVSDYKFDNLEDYYEYGIENYRVFPTSGTTKDNINNYQDSYTEVIHNTYEYLGEKLDIEDFVFCLIIGYLVYILLLLLIQEITEYNYNSFFDILDLKQLLRDIKEYNCNVDNDNLRLKELAEKVNELLEKINQNEDLREKFRELYEKNKYLLNDREELDKRINKILNNDNKEKAKVLTRKYVKEK